MQSPVPITDPRYFPEYLLCDHIPYGEGPTWSDITIGTTLFDDALTHLYLIGEYQIRLDDEYFTYLGLKNDEETKEYATEIPDHIAICVNENNIVGALGLLYRDLQEVDIYDLIAMYGKPDIVTWTARPLDRIVFWFEQGLAATIYVGPEPEFQYRIRAVYFFPYLDTELYQNKWPYRFTRPDDGLSPVEQNPFDFDAVVATITAEPSPTLTPTFEAVTTATP